MKLARFSWQGKVQWGVVVGDMLHSLEGELWGEMKPGAAICRFEDARILAPVEPHNKVMGLGLTYKDMYRDLQGYVQDPGRQAIPRWPRHLYEAAEHQCRSHGSHHLSRRVHPAHIRG